MWEARHGESPAPVPPSPERIDGNFAGKHIISLSQFDPKSLAMLFSLATEMKQASNDGSNADLLRGKHAVLLFYEASSRTMGSFNAAMQRLGGSTTVITDPEHFSSVSKGETHADTIQTFGAYGHVIIQRHRDEGSARAAAEVSRVPIINAGDGIGEHPTQALLDLHTIREHTGTLEGMHGLIAGDIKNGRTIHSLLDGLAMFPRNTIHLLSPEALRLQPERLARLREAGLAIHEHFDTTDLPKNTNFWYWTRVQKERFSAPEEYEAVRNRFIVTQKFLHDHGNEDMVLMHPLPRVGEIDPEVDRDPRAIYLRSQVENGLYVRMALLALVLGKKP